MIPFEESIDKPRFCSTVREGGEIFEVSVQSDSFQGTNAVLSRERLINLPVE